jgi:hypothetical protein
MTLVASNQPLLRIALAVCPVCGREIGKRTSFPLDTPISVVNSLDNLVGLCPNCHWEFDHGLLQL